MKREGTPCGRCGGTLRYVKRDGTDGGCVACALARNKTPYARGKQEEWARSEAGKAWRQSWKGSAPQLACSSRSRVKSGKSSGFPLHGPVPPKPALCDNPHCPNGRIPSARGICADHDHSLEFNNFRGWLCNECNRGQGLLGDNPEALEWCAALIRSKRVS